MTDEEIARALEALAINVADIRHRLGMSQTALAERAELSQQKVNAIEQGRENVTLRTLTRIAVALGVEPGVLLRRSGKK